MNVKAANPRVSFDLNGHMSLTVEIDPSNKNTVKGGIGALQDRSLSVEIKPFRKKRSLDANAFAWVLIGKIAEKVKSAPTDVYRELIRDVGGNYEIVPVKAERAEAWINIWKSHGIGWVSEILGESKLDGYVNIISYYGSSTYDTAQMSRLIDCITDECAELGIDTATPAEIALLKEGWGM
ncbi:MAG TPA: hypothetical protein VN512_13040 [Clostridia bacterium]|nr:hypothetical protein [Clostridia bacterium]